MRLFFSALAAGLVLGVIVLAVTGSFVAAAACAAYVVVVIPLAVLVGRAIRGRSTPPSSH
ncbi:hypothetical protein [Streptomyces sp. LMG1-1-1.1]|uniref:hypothetical protein n=1 Tax=Streptomyces sp. LMG1-1-1.1 TaxID=3135245 RepID=UPI0034660650